MNFIYRNFRYVLLYTIVDMSSLPALLSHRHFRSQIVQTFTMLIVRGVILEVVALAPGNILERR